MYCQYSMCSCIKIYDFKEKKFSLDDIYLNKKTLWNIQSDNTEDITSNKETFETLQRKHLHCSNKHFTAIETSQIAEILSKWETFLKGNK